MERVCECVYGVVHVMFSEYSVWYTCKVREGCRVCVRGVCSVLCVKEVSERHVFGV